MNIATYFLAVLGCSASCGTLSFTTTKNSRKPLAVCHIALKDSKTITRTKAQHNTHAYAKFNKVVSQTKTQNTKIKQEYLYKYM